MSSGSPMTRHRSAGSPAASATPACCEPATSTGPTGFELARLLHSMGISCQVIAPSLIPKAPGRQGPRPTGAITGGSPRLHRAGELVAIRIPTVQEEAVRDLCRTSVDMVQDLAVVEVGNAQPDAVEADLAGWCDRPPLDSAGRPAGRLPRGHPAGRAEVGRSRSLTGAGSPRPATSWGSAGWSQASCSSGTSVHRGRLTKAGNGHLRAQLARVGLGLAASPRRRRRDRPPPAGP